ncbi:CBS domain-containing protein [Malonomonas rubra]|uniref:CBS domain-containing protein n=1 Tax=Malonomonas rubra TaxID=57040 RepID=UPI0026ED34FE|nr:CBS domain-containing protein [Malonomonas rubra]
MNVGQVCNREVIIVNQDASILKACQLMRQHHVGSLLIVDEQEGRRYPVGIITDRDIVVELLAEELPLDRISIGDAMSFELLTATENDDLLFTIKRMRTKGVRRAPVIASDGTLVGLLAVDDIIELLTEQLTDLVALIANERSHERNRRS